MEVVKDGATELYYSLQKKMLEMADLLNKSNLSMVPIDDPKDKTFDRLRAIWADSEKIAMAAKSLGELAGVLKPNKSEERKPFTELIAEKRF